MDDSFAAPGSHRGSVDDGRLRIDTAGRHQFRLTGDELPYSCTVVVETFEEEGEEGARRVRIAASIVVEREAHKGMVIGEGGARLDRKSTRLNSSHRT